MSRYIDADALLKNINENVAKAHNERCAQLLEAILYAPTADVVEVRHGEWLEVDSDIGYVEAGCSLCKCRVLFHSDPSYHYCPNCGAKMDGRSADDGHST